MPAPCLFVVPDSQRFVRQDEVHAMVVINKLTEGFDHNKISVVCATALRPAQTNHVRCIDR